LTTSGRKYASGTQNAAIKDTITAKKARPGKDLPAQIQARTDLDEALSTVKTTCSATLSPDRVPSEDEVITALAKCNALAESLASDLPPAAPAANVGAASALLSLDEAPAKQPSSSNSPAVIERTLDQLSELAFQVIKYPTVFISPRILELYVKIQATLRRPDTLPEALRMYAHKPTPREGQPLRYIEPNPHNAANSVAAPTADLALQTAIDARQLQAAMGIVESTYGTLAFQRSKFVRRGLIPAAGAVALPAAAYTVATQLAHLQTNMDSGLATNVAFAGIMAYTLFTGTIGIVAITTANDQMDRVTWAPGIPLRERWIREEERHAIDKIAGAWGFRESWRRGEEEGDDWVALREWIGGKGMMLDRVDLMEGME
jgi:hypothetical protein